MISLRMPISCATSGGDNVGILVSFYAGEIYEINVHCVFFQLAKPS